MIRCRKRVGLAAAVLLALGVIPFAHAAEKDTDEGGLEQKSARGLNFKLPPDWPVEERIGIVAPIPPEEYYARKFSAVESRLQAVEKQTSSLELRLRALEEKVKQQNQSGGLRSKETGP